MKKEDKLINDFLLSMLKGEDTFFIDKKGDGSLVNCIAVEDIIKHFKDFKEMWESKDA